MELRRQEQQRPNPLGQEQLKRIQRLASDMGQVWSAASTTDRDRKELLRTLLEEVILNLKALVQKRQVPRMMDRCSNLLRWRIFSRVAISTRRSWCCACAGT